MTTNEKPITIHATGIARGAMPKSAITTPKTTQWAGVYATTAAAKRGRMLQSPTDALPASPIPRPPAASTSSEPTATTTAWLITHPVRERLVDSTGSARPATSSDRGRDPAITTYAATIT